MRNGGRFNAVGTSALYTSLTQAGAWVEAQNGFRHKAQPLTICQYDIDCHCVLDLTNPMVLDDCGIDASLLGGGWLDLVDRGITPYTWSMSQQLIELGVAAIIVPSYATAATNDMRNLVFWQWSTCPPAMVRVIDDEGRLPAPPTD